VYIDTDCNYYAGDGSIVRFWYLLPASPHTKQCWLFDRWIKLPFPIHIQYISCRLCWFLSIYDNYWYATCTLCVSGS